MAALAGARAVIPADVALTRVRLRTDHAAATPRSGCAGRRTRRRSRRIRRLGVALARIPRRRLSRSTSPPILRMIARQPPSSTRRPNRNSLMPVAAPVQALLRNSPAFRPPSPRHPRGAPRQLDRIGANADRSWRTRCRGSAVLRLRRSPRPPSIAPDPSPRRRAGARPPSPPLSLSAIPSNSRSSAAAPCCARAPCSRPQSLPNPFSPGFGTARRRAPAERFRLAGPSRTPRGCGNRNREPRRDRARFALRPTPRFSRPPFRSRQAPRSLAPAPGSSPRRRAGAHPPLATLLIDPPSGTKRPDRYPKTRCQRPCRRSCGAACIQRPSSRNPRCAAAGVTRYRFRVAPGIPGGNDH